MKKKILLAGLYTPGSGLTNVMEALADELSKTFEVSCLGFGPSDRVGHEDVTLRNCSVHIQYSPFRHFWVDPRWLDKRFGDTPPDTVLLISPGYVGKLLLQQLQPWRNNTRIVLYLPIEGSLANEEFAPIIEQVDLCILYTESARKDVKAMCDRAIRGRPEYKTPDLAVVGHGADSTRFFPIESFDEKHRRRLARRELYGSDSAAMEAFIILNANKPYWRKRLDITISGFALFADGKPDVLLHLHTGQRSDYDDMELRKMIDASGVATQIRLTPESTSANIFGKSELNALYNACDIGLSTSMGEGWGLGIFEHAMTRCALVVPDHTSFRENWSGAAWLMPVSGIEFVFYEAANMHTVNALEVYTALEALYYDDELRVDLAESAYRRASHESNSWKNIGRLISQHL